MLMSLEKVGIMSRSSLAFVRDLAKSLRSSTKNTWLSDFESVILNPPSTLLSRKDDGFTESINNITLKASP